MNAVWETHPNHSVIRRHVNHFLVVLGMKALTLRHAYKSMKRECTGRQTVRREKKEKSQVTPTD